VDKDKKTENAIAIAQATASLTGHPHIAAALKAAAFAATRYRDRRLSAMWKHAVHGDDDGVDFTNRVEQALLEDGNAVGDGFIAAAQAAADANSFAVVPSIGLLARRYLNTCYGDARAIDRRDSANRSALISPLIDRKAARTRAACARVRPERIPCAALLSAEILPVGLPSLRRVVAERDNPVRSMMSALLSRQEQGLASACGCRGR